MTQEASSSRTDPQQPTLLRVCRIGRAQGLKGEVNVFSYTDDPKYRFAPEAELQTEEGRIFVVERSRQFKARWIIKFAGIDDRNASEALNGTVLYIDPAEDDDTEDDDFDAESGSESESGDADDGYYFVDLVGLKAILRDGTVVGEVTEAFDRPGQSLLEITEPQGSVSLVPFVEQIVPDVDLEAGTVTLDPPGGLLQELS
ncbi:MAG: ribosome maturation factor RimM [Bifidobacteriaceae bacterium]|jgi:16S rRNA processing protein RimM|nr:ribosome maturation factor RimM [Bifidobacteriaceae bacterium]MCI1914274.1 ribosome maturation factor RimM [Bifidobacteriaceae bacterium]